MNRIKKSLVIAFDCDGVIFDSRQANINFYNQLLSHFNLPPLRDEDIPFVHMHTAEESIKHIFRETPYGDQALTHRLTMDYTSFIIDMVFEPGFRALLRRLEGKFGLAVATNRSNTIGDVIRHHGLSGCFDIVVSSLDVTHPKPHPESLIKICDFFRIGPAQCLYVGDSEVDSLTAQAAGVPFVSYKNPKIHADYRVNHFSEMDGIIQNWKAASSDRGTPE